MYFSHLECSEPCGAGPFDARQRHHVCPAAACRLLARYDLIAARAWSRDSLLGRPPTMWRYRELLPLFPGETPLTLGEGFTPLLRTVRLGDAVGLDRLFVKDESFNPTNSFKARGQATAITQGQGARRHHDYPADRRQCRQRRGRLRRRRRHAAARCSCRGTPSSRSSTSAGSTAPPSRSSTG